jgi:hypothetical protein
VVPVDQNLDALENNIVRLTPRCVGDKPDAAGIVFVLRVIKPLSGRKAREWVHFLHFSIYSQYHDRIAL